MAIRVAIVSARQRMRQLMEQPPRRASIRQPYRKPSGVGHYGADLAGQWFDLRRKAQPHLGPDGIHHALRLCKHDRTRIVWRNEALFPCVHLAALAVVFVGHGSKALPASPTGRLRLTRSPATIPCRNAPLARARLRPATDTRRILVSLNASSTTCCLKKMRSVPVERWPRHAHHVRDACDRAVSPRVLPCLVGSWSTTSGGQRRVAQDAELENRSAQSPWRGR